VLRPIRYRLPTLSMGLDLSPMVVILAIYFLDTFLVNSLRDLALSLR
jgi:YggT family protein